MVNISLYWRRGGRLTSFRVPERSSPNIVLDVDPGPAQASLIKDKGHFRPSPSYQGPFAPTLWIQFTHFLIKAQWRGINETNGYSDAENIVLFLAITADLGVNFFDQIFRNLPGKKTIVGIYQQLEAGVRCVKRTCYYVNILIAAAKWWTWSRKVLWMRWLQSLDANRAFSFVVVADSKWWQQM